MRGAVTDNRLEAIAGKPYLVTTEPTMVEGTPPGTTVFAGLKPLEGEYRCAIQNRTGTGPASVNVYWDTTGTVLSRIGAQLVSSAPVTEVYAYHNEPRLGIGRGSLASQFWDTEFMAATYDRILSAAEALRVTRWLSLSLSLSHTHTHTHTHTHS